MISYAARHTEGERGGFNKHAAGLYSAWNVAFPCIGDGTASGRPRMRSSNAISCSRITVRADASVNQQMAHAPPGVVGFTNVGSTGSAELSGPSIRFHVSIIWLSAATDAVILSATWRRSNDAAAADSSSAGIKRKRESIMSAMMERNMAISETITERNLKMIQTVASEHLRRRYPQNALTPGEAAGILFSVSLQLL